MDASRYGIQGDQLNVWMQGMTSNLLQSLFFLMTLDIVGGLLVAFIQKKMSSTVSWRGMGKKAMTFVVILTIAILQQTTKLPPIVLFGVTMTFLEGSIVFYLTVEAISVFEKAAILGVPLPKSLVDALVKIKGDSKPALSISIVNQNKGKDKTNESQP